MNSDRGGREPGRRAGRAPAARRRPSARRRRPRRGWSYATAVRARADPDGETAERPGPLVRATAATRAERRRTAAGLGPGRRPAVSSVVCRERVRLRATDRERCHDGARSRTPRDAPPRAAAAASADAGLLRWRLARHGRRAARARRRPRARRTHPRRGQAGHLPVHARRPVAGRHVRLQAAARPRPRQAAARSPSRGSCSARPATCSSRRGSSSSTARAASGQRAVPARRAGASTTCASIHSMHGTNAAHGGALLEAAHRQRQLRPAQHRARGSPTAWARENREPAGVRHDLPDAGATAASNNWGSAFLPAAYQGTPLGNASIAGRAGQVRYIRAAHGRDDLQRLQLDLLARAEPRAPATGPAPDAALEGRIESFELAFRMQAAVPERAGPRRARPPRRGSCTASTTRRPTTSAGSACWPGGSPSAACGSSRCTHS